MQLDKLIKQPLDKVQRMGAVSVTSELHSFNGRARLSFAGAASRLSANSEFFSLLSHLGHV